MTPDQIGPRMEQLAHELLTTHKTTSFSGSASVDLRYNVTISGGACTAKALRNVCRQLELTAGFLDEDEASIRQAAEQARESEALSTPNKTEG